MAGLTDAQRDEVTGYAAWLAEDVEFLAEKPWLAPSLASHTARHTGLPQAQIQAAITDHFWGCKHTTEVIMQEDVDNKSSRWTCLSCGNKRVKP